MTIPTGRPKGRPPKNNNEPPIPGTIDETVIDEVKPPPAVKVRQNGKFTTSELAEKLNILLGGGARMLGYEYQYEASNYNQEASGLIRLIEKYPAIGKVVVLFDPLLIIFGIIGKFKNLTKKKVETKPGAPAPANSSTPNSPLYSVTQR